MEQAFGRTSPSSISIIRALIHTFSSQAREEFRGKAGQDGGKGVKDFMEGMGLGGWVEQLGELKLGELLDTPPPGKGAQPACAQFQCQDFGWLGERVGGNNRQVKLATT